MTPRRLVVVLGGGGAKAAAHIGAQRALNEAGLRPMHYVGTSMGAVFAAMFGSGLVPSDALGRAATIRTRDVARPHPLLPFRGLWLRAMLRPDPLSATIARLVPARSFEQLRVPLTVTATAMDTGELVLFGASGRSLPLLDALYASCALPVYYPPLLLDQRAYADGGLRAVLPLEPARALDPDLIVAIDVGPGFDQPARPAAAPRSTPALIQAHDDATTILMAASTADSLALYRTRDGRPPLIYVRPRVERGATFRVDQVHHYAEEGYRATREALADLIPRAV